MAEAGQTVEAILTASAMQRPHLTESSYVSALRIKSCRQSNSTYGEVRLQCRQIQWVVRGAYIREEGAKRAPDGIM